MKNSRRSLRSRFFGRISIRSALFVFSLLCLSGCNEMQAYLMGVEVPGWATTEFKSDSSVRFLYVGQLFSADSDGTTRQKAGEAVIVRRLGLEGKFIYGLILKPADAYGSASSTVVLDLASNEGGQSNFCASEIPLPIRLCFEIQRSNAQLKSGDTMYRVKWNTAQSAPAGLPTFTYFDFPEREEETQFDDNGLID